MKFDFDDSGDKPASNAPEFTVSELSGKVKSFIEGEFSYVRVRGELGRVSKPASGHIYLDLKDENAVISGVIWRGKAASLAIAPEQGLEVIATGKLTTFPGQSKYQIVIDKIEPAGQGALMALLEERKKKLAAEGLMDESVKQSLPFMPRVVGIVTSPTGAVIRDMMHGFRERFPVHVIVWPVRVQGEMAAREIAGAIAGFNKIPDQGGACLRPDVLIVARGGGSLEDLWSFNEEIVARAAAASQIPLISAVGHETDWTLLDYVADSRAPTPTKAAEWAVPKFSELVSRVADLKARHVKVISLSLQNKRMGLKSAARGLPRLVDLMGIPRQRLDGASGRLVQSLTNFTRAKRAHLQRFEGRLQPFVLNQRLARGRERLGLFSNALGQQLRRKSSSCREKLSGLSLGLRPLMVIARMERGREQLNQVGARQKRAFEGAVVRQRQQVDQLGQLMNSLSYQSVLARGFAMVRDGNGAMVRSAQGLDGGEILDVEFVDGRVLTEIQVGSSGKAGGKKGLPVKTVKSKSSKKGLKKGPNDDQGSLF